jgi:hypothetical protein
MESWEDIFRGSDTNVIFNNFLNIYLKIFNACVTKSKHNSAYRYNPWITRGMKISCHNKRILYMSCRGSIDTNLKLRYKRYCKILTDVIKTAKQKMYYNELIFKFKNKTKTTWKIIKKEIGNNCQNGIKSLKLNNIILNNPQEIASTFNDNLSTVANTVIRNITKGNGDSKDDVDLSSYLISNFNNTFSRIKWKYATTYEINKIIKSLKTYDEIPIKILR